MRRPSALLLVLSACGPGPLGDAEDPAIERRALPLEGARNDALREAERAFAVPAELLMVLGFQQGRFEPAELADHGEAAPPEMDAEHDPATEVEAEGEPVEDEELTPEPVLELPPDESDLGLVTSLEEDVDASDPEASSTAQDDLEAAAAGDPHLAPGSAGLMYLTEAQVQRGAALTGHPPEQIREEVRANVEAAAAILAAEAEAAGLDPASRDLERWAPILARFVGADDGEEVAALAIGELRSLWTHGFDLTTGDGERLALPALPGAIAESAQALRPGAYPRIQFIAAASSNYSRGRSGRVRYVVIHDIEGTMPGAIAVFRNPGRQASAHYVIRARDGHIVQMVNESNTAWHSGHGYFNANSIGIEHEGFASRPRGGGYYNATQYQASANLVCAIVKKYRIPVDRRHIFGHGNVPSDQGRRTLCSDRLANAARCGGRSHHYDPGKYWDWSTYMRLIARCASNRPEPTPQPPPTTSARTTVKGLVYRGSDPAARIAGATVRLGARTARTNANGLYVFADVPRGNQTIRVSAAGYASRSITRAVSGRETWGSLGLSRAAASGTAVLKGVVYRGRSTNRVAGATIELSNGKSARTNASGVYQIDGLAPGTYTISASKSGVGRASTRRTLSHGQLTWGSVGL